METRASRPPVLESPGALVRNADSRKLRGSLVGPPAVCNKCPRSRTFSRASLETRPHAPAPPGFSLLLTLYPGLLWPPPRASAAPTRSSPSLDQVGPHHFPASSASLRRSCPFNCGWTRSRTRCLPAGALATPAPHSWRPAPQNMLELSLGGEQGLCDPSCCLTTQV